MSDKIDVLGKHIDEIDDYFLDKPALIESVKGLINLHVHAALHYASTKVSVKVKHDYEKNPGTYDITINKKSILDAYPLENIK